MDINDMVMRWVLVDTSSNDTFTRLGLERGQLKAVRTLLVGFTGNSVELEG